MSDGQNAGTLAAGHVPAAMYVRMSTEHQQYSTENQADTIRKYAEQHGFEIVATFADEGKSGLTLGGRESLQLSSPAGT
jgi:DNA invertase Pin-like site-specific DNA recombinase